MPDNIAVKKVTVADPEIGFSIVLDRATISAEANIPLSQLKISGITVKIEVTHDNNPNQKYTGIVGVGRTDRYGQGAVFEEVVNNEFDFIYPFIDPDFYEAKIFNYEIFVTVNSMKTYSNGQPIPLIPTKSFTGSQKNLGKTYLKPYLNKGEFDFRDLALRDDHMPSNQVSVTDIVVGKAGLGARVHWGSDFHVRAAKFVVRYDNGKSTVGLNLNDVGKRARFSPLNVFVPFPRGIDHKEDFQYDIDFYLYGLDGNSRLLELNIGDWQQRLQYPAPLKDTESSTENWEEVEITDKQLACTFPEIWKTNYDNYDSVKLAAFNRWAVENGYQLCIPTTAVPEEVAATAGTNLPPDKIWKAIAHNLQPEFNWANLQTSQMGYAANPWPVDDPENLASKVFMNVQTSDSRKAAWPTWEIGVQNNQTVLGAFTFPSNLAGSTIKLPQQIAIDPSQGFLHNIEKVMAEAKRLGYKGGIVAAFNYSRLQPIFAFT